MRKQHTYLCWYCTKLFRRILLVSVLLQSSFGFNYNEDEYVDDAPAFYRYYEDVPWKIPQKMPRGFMYPVPRVGRSTKGLHQDKRQSMIPQPRIGRELEAGSELAEILYNIQKFFPGVQFQPLNPRKDVGRGKTLTLVSRDMAEKYLPGESGNSANLANKDSTLTSKEISEERVEESPNFLQESDPDHKIGISFTSPKEDRLFMKDTKSTGFNIFENNKRDGFLPLVPADKARLLTAAFGDKKQIGGLIAYPRLGRHVLELHSSLFPFSRSRSFLVEPELLSDYELLLSTPESDDTGLEDILTDALLTSQPVVKKSRSMKLIPRIGRKKRSAPDEEEDGQEKPEEIEMEHDDLWSSRGDGKVLESKPLWHSLQDLDDEYTYNLDKRNVRSKNAFIPRIGKKRFENLDIYDDKRGSMAFQPRIGRASLIPRIGRSDPRFRLRGRGAFVPRIGRRAALIPRIGRSANRPEDNTDSE